MFNVIKEAPMAPSNWELPQIKEKLKAIGKLEGKAQAWICADLSISESNCVTRLFWTCFAKHFEWTRKALYNVQLESSKSALEGIKSKVLSSNDPEIKTLYSTAIKTFNSIAPRHQVEKPAEQMLPQVKSKAEGKTVDVINEKAKLVLNAKNWLGNKNNQKKAKEVTQSDQNDVEEALEILKNLHQKQQQGQAVPVPFYYHATKLEGIKGIAQNQKITVSSKASMGPGAYVSTNDEVIYGSYTFALDNESIEHQEALYFTGPRWRSQAYQINKYDGLWVSVQGNIPTTPKTVPYIIAERHEVEQIKTVIAPTELKDVPVVARKVANVVRYALDTMLTERTYPKANWKPHKSAPRIVSQFSGIFLPKNAQHFDSLPGKMDNDLAHHN